MQVPGPAKDHRDAVLQLVRHYGWRRGAELGLANGHLSRRLLEGCPELSLIGVDIMRRPDRAAKVRELERRFRPRYQVLETLTVEAAAQVADDALDFVFIDAGHHYHAVAADIEAWWPKVRPGGAMLGHDYGHPKYPGVAEAVHEAFGGRVEVLGHTIWGVAC